ncbi:hypothetical protein AGMMS49982_02070 [Bacteroidia bacterium]|nr:hypothetical protein AGMMS49982_02070 [Bacteroidia bacterium]
MTGKCNQQRLRTGYDTTILRACQVVDRTPFLSTPDGYNEKKFKSGGILRLPKKFHQNPQEAQKNVKAYTDLAKYHGEQYQLLNVVNETGRKNPDALNLKTGMFSDAKIPITENGKNAIQASIKSASEQKVSEVYIYAEHEYAMYDIWLGIKAALQGGRAKSIETIIIRMKNGEIKKYDVAKLRKIFDKSKGKAT